MAEFFVFLGALAGGFVSGLAGFGTGLTALGIWLYVMTPPLAASLVVVCSVAAQVQTIPVIWHAIEPKLVTPFIVGGLLGVPLGTALVLYLDPYLVSLRDRHRSTRLLDGDAVRRRLAADRQRRPRRGCAGRFRRWRAGRTRRTFGTAADDVGGVARVGKRSAAERLPVVQPGDTRRRNDYPCRERHVDRRAVAARPLRPARVLFSAPGSARASTAG